MISAWIDVATTAPVAFVVGVLVGFVLSNRYRIVKRNGGEDE